MDLQHDGVVYMVENFCSRASPTNSREGERKASKAARVWRIGGGHSPSPSPKPRPAAPKDKEWGARKPPF